MRSLYTYGGARIYREARIHRGWISVCDALRKIRNGKLAAGKPLLRLREVSKFVVITLIACRSCYILFVNLLSVVICKRSVDLIRGTGTDTQMHFTELLKGANYRLFTVCTIKRNYVQLLVAVPMYRAPGCSHALASRLSLSIGGREHPAYLGVNCARRDVAIIGQHGHRHATPR